jgi:F-type H+-transporting ATPase subunit epsilon
MIDGKKRYGACIGGMVSVVNGTVTLVPTTFEWAEDIDLKRAESAAERAKSIIANKDTSSADIRLAESRLKRALVRSSVAKPM